MPRKKLDSVLSPMKIRRRNSGLGRMSFYYHVFLESIFYSSYVMNVVSNIFLLDTLVFFANFSLLMLVKSKVFPVHLLREKFDVILGLFWFRDLFSDCFKSYFSFSKLLTQLLNSFYLMFHIHIDGFLTFSGGMEMEHWAKKA